MGEHEISDLLLMTIAVFVFAIIVTLFITFLYAILKWSNSIHNNVYEVN